MFFFCFFSVHKVLQATSHSISDNSNRAQMYAVVCIQSLERHCHRIFAPPSFSPPSSLRSRPETMRRNLVNQSRLADINYCGTQQIDRKALFTIKLFSFSHADCLLEPTCQSCHARIDACVQFVEHWLLLRRPLAELCAHAVCFYFPIVATVLLFFFFFFTQWRLFCCYLKVYCLPRISKLHFISVAITCTNNLIYCKCTELQCPEAYLKLACFSVLKKRFLYIFPLIYFKQTVCSHFHST